MGKNRFLIPAYLINTAKIKAKALQYRLTRGAYPYDYFKLKVDSQLASNYQLTYSDSYHSLTYLDTISAALFHQDSTGITAQIIRALVLYNDLVIDDKKETKTFISSVKDILSRGKFIDNSLLFYIDEDYDRFDLKGPYLSAIVQGKIASLFLRCYRLTEDQDWLQLARKVINSYTVPLEDGGFSRSLVGNMSWMEEYPSPKPSMVLNGFLFWLIGLGEYLAIADDKELQITFETQLTSAICWMPAYKLEHGLLYSMYRWNPCNVHYTAIMKYEFEHLYRLTGVAIFQEYASHVDKSTNWKVFEKLIAT